MNTASEVVVIMHAGRHCTEYGCRKCAARGRWNRRKGWRSRKSPIRRAAGRK